MFVLGASLTTISEMVNAVKLRTEGWQSYFVCLSRNILMMTGSCETPAQRQSLMTRFGSQFSNVTCSRSMHLVALRNLQGADFCSSFPD